MAIEKITGLKQKIKSLNEQISVLLLCRQMSKCGEIRDRISYKLDKLYSGKHVLLRQLGVCKKG